MRNTLVTLMITAMPFVAPAAAPKTAVLDVQNMTCGLCPLTVRKSLERVPGVSQAHIDFGQKTATVTFDPDKTSAAALVKATTDAGFPSALRQ